MYTVSSFPSCCGARIINDVSGINRSDLIGLNKRSFGMTWPNYTLYAILNVQSQAKALKLFYKHGWINTGRKWRSRTGSTLQTIVRYPIKRK